MDVWCRRWIEIGAMVDRRPIYTRLWHSSEYSLADPVLGKDLEHNLHKTLVVSASLKEHLGWNPTTSHSWANLSTNRNSVSIHPNSRPTTASHSFAVMRLAEDDLSRKLFNNKGLMNIRLPFS
jgi:hypothetical protein